jgi:putative transposase
MQHDDAMTKSVPPKVQIGAVVLACPRGTGPSRFRVLLPVNWADRTMENMAGRKRNSAEDIVRKLRRADELTAAGKTQEEIAADLEVSAATLYNWRRQYGGMDTDAAKELKELREQNSKLKRLLAEAELEKDALREIAKGKF